MTTVFRLPEEPPPGTTVEPANGIGLRHKRLLDDESTWQAVGGYGAVRSWGGLLDKHPEGLVVVEPDPHPTPWTVGGTDDTYLVDANDQIVLEVQRPGGYTGRTDRLKFQLAERIVDAVNKAATT